MTVTVEKLQSEWRGLVELASRGEDVVLTSEGRVVARITGVQEPKTPRDPAAWLAELALLRQATATGKTTPTTEQILEDLRSERG